MYEYLVGEVSEVSSNGIVLDVNDVGYQIMTSANTAINLSGVEGKVKIYTYLALRDDGMYLYGFSSKEERSLFFKLISVPKVGPKVALSVLSAFDVSQIAYMIVSEDYKSLSMANGVGKKTAEQIVVTLKDKFNDISEYQNVNNIKGESSVDSIKAEAMLALTSLGFDRGYASKLIGEAYYEGIGLEDLISSSLTLVNR